MKMNRNNNTDEYIIIGAGPVGLLTALAIHQKSNDKASITIYERRDNVEQRLEESYPIGVTQWSTCLAADGMSCCM